MKPNTRPARPDFSSGPCAKRPGWTPEVLIDAAVGRSHRSKLGKKKIVEAVDRTRAAARHSRRLPHRHRAGLGHRRRRDGAVVAAGRRGRSTC